MKNDVRKLAFVFAAAAMLAGGAVAHVSSAEPLEVGAAEGDALATLSATDVASGSTYKRYENTEKGVLTLGSINQGTAYLGASKAINYTAKFIDKDLPVLRAAKPDISLGTAGWNAFYFRTAHANIGKVVFNTTEIKQTAPKIYLASSVNLESDFTKVVSDSVTLVQGDNTWNFKTVEESRYYAIIFESTSWFRLTGGTITLFEGAPSSIDQGKIEHVISDINDLVDMLPSGVTSLEDCGLIDLVAESYNNLTSTEKSLVTNSEQLLALIKQANDLRSATNVDSLIAAFKDSQIVDYSLAEQVFAARDAYENLNDEAKLLVTLLADLERVEEELKAYAPKTDSVMFDFAASEFKGTDVAGGIIKNRINILATKANSSNPWASNDGALRIYAGSAFKISGTEEVASLDKVKFAFPENSYPGTNCSLTFFPSKKTISNLSDAEIVCPVGTTSIEFENTGSKQARLGSISLVYSLIATDPNQKVNEILLSPISADLDVNETFDVTATVNPASAANKDLEWTTSNENIATVLNGRVTAVQVGQATITATAKDGSGISASMTINVKASAIIDYNPSSKVEGNVLDVGNDVALTVVEKASNPYRGFAEGHQFGSSKQPSEAVLIETRGQLFDSTGLMVEVISRYSGTSGTLEVYLGNQQLGTTIDLTKQNTTYAFTANGISVSSKGTLRIVLRNETGAVYLAGLKVYGTMETREVGVAEEIMYTISDERFKNSGSVCGLLNDDATMSDLIKKYNSLEDTSVLAIEDVEEATYRDTMEYLISVYNPNAVSGLGFFRDGGNANSALLAVTIVAGLGLGAAFFLVRKKKSC